MTNLLCILEAFYKIKLSIESCETTTQLEACTKLIELFEYTGGQYFTSPYKKLTNHVRVSLLTLLLQDSISYKVVELLNQPKTDPLPP